MNIGEVVVRLLQALQVLWYNYYRRLDDAARRQVRREAAGCRLKLGHGRYLR